MDPNTRIRQRPSSQQQQLQQQLRLQPSNAVFKSASGVEHEHEHEHEHERIHRSGFRDQFLVLKPHDARSRRSIATATATATTSLKLRSHPWGADAQGLQEVETQAGDTATMGDSTWFGDRNDTKRDKGLGHRILSRQLSQQKSMVSKALRLDQEEEDDHFRDVKIRRGIVNARKKHLGLPAQHWKTPYEVDAPRAIMLPRDHPQETSSSGTSSNTNTVSLEQQIWNGIEMLMADAFSDDASSAASNALPAALVKALSTESLNSQHEHPNPRSLSGEEPGRRNSTTSEASKDEIEMAQAALTSFMDMLMPGEGEGEGECESLSEPPSLASYGISLEGGEGHAVPLRVAEAADELGLTHEALNNFINILLKDVEANHKPSSLLLLDLFSWTMRVNVDAKERLHFLQHDEQSKLRQTEKIAEDLRRHDELVYQREAEEAELQRLEEEGNRIEEILMQKVKEADQLRKEAGIREYVQPLNDAFSSASEQSDNDSSIDTSSFDVPSTPAGRRRMVAEQRQKKIELRINADEEKDAVAIATEEQPFLPRYMKVSMGEDRLTSYMPDNLNEESLQSIPVRYLPREMSLLSIPTLGTLESRLQDDSSAATDFEGATKSKVPMGPSWATLGGAPLVVSSGDESSIDPANLGFPCGRRNSTSMTSSTRRALSSTEIQHRRDSISNDKSIDVFSTHSVPMLMPSENKRSLKAAFMYVESQFSIDPSTLPNLSLDRQEMKTAQRKAHLEQQAEKRPPTDGNLPKWAAIGGKPIIMPTGSYGFSSSTNEFTDNTGGSPDTPQSEILPSSFHGKEQLSNSGSASHTFFLSSDSTMPSVRTSLALNNFRRKLEDSGSIATTDDLPELRSICEASCSGTASVDSSVKELSQIPPPPTHTRKGPPLPLRRDNAPLQKQFSDTQLSRSPSFSNKKGAEAGGFEDSFVKLGHFNNSPHLHEMSNNIFRESFLARMQQTDGRRPEIVPETLPNSFINKSSDNSQHDAELPSSFVNQFDLPDGAAAAAQHAEVADATAVKAKDEKKKKDKKKDKKKKKKNKAFKQEFYGTPSQRNLVVSASGDVFLDDVQLASLNNLPVGHFDSQSQTPESDLASGDGLHNVPPVTDVISVGSSGDIHLGSAPVFAISSDDDQGSTSSDDITIDDELRLDELRKEGRRNHVPFASTTKRKYQQRKSFGRRIVRGFSKCIWSPTARRRNKQDKKNKKKKTPEEPDKELSSNLCLLYDENEKYDRTPVLHRGHLERIDDIGFAPL